MKRILSLVNSGESRGYVDELIGFFGKDVLYRKRIVDVGGKRMLRLYVDGGVVEACDCCADSVGDDEVKRLAAALIVSEEKLRNREAAVTSFRELYDASELELVSYRLQLDDSVKEINRLVNRGFWARVFNRK